MAACAFSRSTSAFQNTNYMPRNMAEYGATILHLTSKGVHASTMLTNLWYTPSRSTTGGLCPRA
jgi:hypothetical protein